MGAQYPVLRYSGNVTGQDHTQEGCLLGWDETGRPYEILDAEYIPGEPGHTNVFLQYAQPENIRRQAAELQASSLRVAQLGARAGGLVVQR